VATESFMQNQYYTNSVILPILDTVLKYKDSIKLIYEGKRKPHILGTEAERRELAKGQFFRSRLIDFDYENMRVTFEVESAKNKKGKYLKKARAFYLVKDLEVTGGAQFPGTSTLFLGGEIVGGQANVTIDGYATFMKPIQINASTSVLTFNPDPVTGVGNVYFNAFYFSETKNVLFNVPTFFNEDAVIKGFENHPVFKNNVGFNKNISTAGYNQSLDIDNGKNMWVNEGFQTRGVSNGGIPVTYSNNKTKIGGSGHLLYNSDRVQTCTDCDDNNTRCSMHNLLKSQHSVAPDISTGSTTSNFVFNKASVLTQLGMTKEAEVTANNLANTSAAAQARKNAEPTLNTSYLPADKEFLTLSGLTNRDPSWGGTQVSLSTVYSWYDTYSIENPDNAKYYNEGHLLVKLDIPVTFSDPSSEFDRKIVFDVGAESNISDKYFNSGENASTMIYVNEKGRLSNFGCDGDFRGLIYIPEDHKGNTNSPDNTFQWGTNTTIYGALLLKGENTKISWNENGGGTVTMIRDEELLKGFTGFIHPDQLSDNNNKTAGLKGTATHITLTPLGYYYNLK